MDIYAAFLAKNGLKMVPNSHVTGKDGKFDVIPSPYTYQQPTYAQSTLAVLLSVSEANNYYLMRILVFQFHNWPRILLYRYFKLLQLGTNSAQFSFKVKSSNEEGDNLL